MERLPVQRNPYLSVDVIIDRDGEIVLVERKEPVPNVLALPGGFVEWGETVEECAAREAREETGLVVRLREILGVYSDAKRDVRGHIVSAVFVADVASGRLALSDEHFKVNWHKLAGVDFGSLHADHAKILQDYLKWKRHKGTYWSGK